MAVLTDQEIIEKVEAIYALNPNATRNVFKQMIGASPKRMEAMHKAGLIKYPAKVHKGMCHLFKKNDKWKNFKLRGSPKGGRVKPTPVKA